MQKVKIDIVYTYVNSKDKKWKEKREKTKLEYYNSEINNIDSNISDRFDDNDELKLSLRSISNCLDFVRNIYIVTDDQIPEWINIHHNKIKIIDHKDIIPHEYLPTFNSHIIELFLHKIPNISSPFMYLNDDIIFMKKMKITDFIDFNDNKFYVFLDNKNYTKKGIPTVNEYGFRSAWKNSNKWLDDNFICESRKKMAHSPMIIYPHILNSIISLMDTKLHNIYNNRFRSINDYNILCSIYMYYSIYNNFAKIYNNSNEHFCCSIFNDDNFSKINNIIDHIYILCINSYSEDVFNYLSTIKYPLQSCFEI